MSDEKLLEKINDLLYELCCIRGRMLMPEVGNNGHIMIDFDFDLEAESNSK